MGLGGGWGLSASHSRFLDLNTPPKIKSIKNKQTKKKKKKSDTHTPSSTYFPLNSNICPQQVYHHLKRRLSLQSGEEISRHSSTLESQAQLERYFHSKRVPTILTIGTEIKKAKAKKTWGEGATFSSRAAGSPDRELGQFLGQIRSFPLRSQWFSQRLPEAGAC